MSDQPKMQARRNRHPAVRKPPGDLAFAWRLPSLPLVMRGVLVVVAGMLMGGMVSAAPRTPHPVTCLKLFKTYDNVVWAYPSNQRGGDRPLQRADVSRAAQRLINGGCLTRSADLDGIPALSQQLSQFVITDSGPTIRPVTVELGIVTGIWDEARVTTFFRGLGYRSRGVGALGLGRRIFIGPFTSQGALDQALDVARKAGFIAPHVATHTRF